MLGRSSLVSTARLATCRRLKDKHGGQYCLKTPWQMQQPDRMSVVKARVSRKDSCTAAELNAYDLSAGLVLSALLYPDNAVSAELPQYDPSTGNELLLNAAGIGYILLVAYFLFRVLSKRAKRFKEQRIADSPSILAGFKQKDPAQQPTAASPRKKLTVLDGLIGVLQSGVLTVGLYFFTTKVDALILSTPLPEQYTAHNIAVTVRTIIRGFCYLFTFVFGMNFLGLSGLTIKLMFDPDSVNNEVVTKPLDTKPQLPKISVVSDPEEVSRAFDEVSARKSEDERT